MSSQSASAVKSAKGAQLSLARHGRRGSSRHRRERRLGGHRADGTHRTLACSQRPLARPLQVLPRYAGPSPARSVKVRPHADRHLARCDRPGRRTAANTCTAGNACPFSHDLPVPGTTKPICQWFAKGTCKVSHPFAPLVRPDGRDPHVTRSLAVWPQMRTRTRPSRTAHVL